MSRLKTKKVIVPDLNQGQVAGEVKKYCRCGVIPFGQTDGEIIRPERIMDLLRRILYQSVR